MRNLSRLLFLLLVGIFLAGCGESKKPSPAEAPTGPVLPALPEGPLTEGLGIGQLAPEIEGEDIEGKRFKLSDYRGKVVVLDFWGNW